jgi:uracil phosphoribosyltransferase
MLRNKNTGSKEFRELVDEIGMLVCYESTRDIELINKTIETPLCETEGNITAKKIAVVPVLRAGIGMTNGILKLIPNAKVGHIGVYRDPNTLEPHEYYCKLPKDISDRIVFLVDPMLATGGTACMAINFLKNRKVKNIKFLCLISTPEGFGKINKEHNDVNVFTAAHDSELNDRGYIVPGLGDAGDRLFGTK